MRKKQKALKNLPMREAAVDERSCELGVCVGYSCRKAGSKDVRAALDREVWRRKLDDRVSVRTIGCVDRCDEGPSVRLSRTGQVITRVRAGDVKRAIDRVLGSISRRGEGGGWLERSSR